MTIELDCDRCGYHLRIADKYAGQTGKCKKCGAKIVARKPEPQPLPPPNPKRHEEAPALPYKWIAGTALALALLAFAIYLILPLASPNEPETPSTPPAASRSE